MKTFSYTTESGLTAPEAVADVDQLVINRGAGTFFLRFLVWASLEAKAAGKPAIGELKLNLEGEAAQELKARNAQLYGALEAAAFVVGASLFPADAKSVGG